MNLFRGDTLNPPLSKDHRWRWLPVLLIWSCAIYFFHANRGIYPIKWKKVL